MDAPFKFARFASKPSATGAQCTQHYRSGQSDTSDQATREQNWVPPTD
ncbi:hypothetical protein [Nocardia sp. NPDC051750]